LKPRVESIIRVQAFARGFDGVYLNKTYDYKIARKLLEYHPGAEAVDITNPRWNTPQVRYVPEDRHIIYIKATGGKWGKSSRTRVGSGCE
jgi:hypothetical protein